MRGGRGLTDGKTSGKGLYGPFASGVNTMVRHALGRSTDTAQHDLPTFRISDSPLAQGS